MTNKYRDICKGLSLSRVLGHLTAITLRHKQDKEFERELIIRYEQLVTGTQSDQTNPTSRDTGPTR
jgi:hypothetical protein